MKKRTFVLFEILIAFALVSVSILPFLHYPFKHMQKEIDALFEMELERVAQNELTVMQERLYRKEISQQLLFAEGEPLRSKGETTVRLPHGLKRTYPKKTKISVETLKFSNEREFSALVKFEIIYKDPKDKRRTSLKVDREMIAQKKI